MYVCMYVYTYISNINKYMYTLKVQMFIIKLIQNVLQLNEYNEKH